MIFVLIFEVCAVAAFIAFVSPTRRKELNRVWRWVRFLFWTVPIALYATALILEAYLVGKKLPRELRIRVVWKMIFGQTRKEAEQ